MDRLIALIVRFFERWMPDAFAVAIGLTLLTFALAIAVTPTTPMQAVEAWGDGFWSLLSFTNQIALTLVLGYALASTPPVHALLLRAAGIVRSLICKRWASIQTLGGDTTRICILSAGWSSRGHNHTRTPSRACEGEHNEEARMSERKTAHPGDIYAREDQNHARHDSA